MCVSRTSVHRRTERRIVHHPDSTVAVWFMGLPDSTVLLTLNTAVLTLPGAWEYAESWFRLHALARKRAYRIMNLDELLLFAPLVAGHQHTAVDLPAAG